MWALTRNRLLSHLSASRHLPSSPISPGSWNSGKSDKYRDEMWLVSDWWKSLQMNDFENNSFQVHSCASYGCNKLQQIWTPNLQTPVLDLHLTKQVVYIIAWTWQKVSTVDGLGWPWMALAMLHQCMCWPVATHQWLLAKRRSDWERITTSQQSSHEGNRVATVQWFTLAIRMPGSNCGDRIGLEHILGIFLHFKQLDTAANNDVASWQYGNCTLLLSTVHTYE